MLDLASYYVIQTIQRILLRVSSAQRAKIPVLALLLCATCFGQSSPVNYDDAAKSRTNLGYKADAPKLNSCGTYTNEYACWGGGISVDLGQFRGVEVDFNLPDSPQPQYDHTEYVGDSLPTSCAAGCDIGNPALHRPANFFTFRKSWQDPPIRSNKQVFKSPVFLLSQSAMVLSMVVACRNKRSGETWGSEVPAVGAVFGLDYLSDRFFSEYFAVGPATYATIHYSRAATR